MKQDPILSIETQDQGLRSTLSRLIKKVGNPSPALKQCGEYLLISTDDRWEKQIDPNGVPWQPNTPYTISLKKSQGRLLKILQSTGTGRSSIRYAIQGDTLVVGTNIEYMKKHQLGIGVPKREFLGISSEDQIEVVQILQEFLQKD